MSCRGAPGTMECRCAITAELTPIRENQRENPENRNREKGKTVAAKKRRCYEVDIGDTIRINDPEAGWIQGVITGMIWDDTGGYRVPDAMAVKWDDGEEGEVDMQDIWEAVGTQGTQPTTSLRLSSQQHKRQEKVPKAEEAAAEGTQVTPSRTAQPPKGAEVERDRWGKAMEPWETEHARWRAHIRDIRQKVGDRIKEQWESGEKSDRVWTDYCGEASTKAEREQVALELWDWCKMGAARFCSGRIIMGESTTRHSSSLTQTAEGTTARNKHKNSQTAEEKEPKKRSRKNEVVNHSVNQNVNQNVNQRENSDKRTKKLKPQGKTEEKRSELKIATKVNLVHKKVNPGGEYKTGELPSPQAATHTPDGPKAANAGEARRQDQHTRGTAGTAERPGPNGKGTVASTWKAAAHEANQCGEDRKNRGRSGGSDDASSEQEIPEEEGMEKGEGRHDKQIRVDDTRVRCVAGHAGGNREAAGKQGKHDGRHTRETNGGGGNTGRGGTWEADEGSTECEKVGGKAGEWQGDHCTYGEANGEKPDKGKRQHREGSSGNPASGSRKRPAGGGQEVRVRQAAEELAARNKGMGKGERPAAAEHEASGAAGTEQSLAAPEGRGSSVPGDRVWVGGSDKRAKGSVRQGGDDRQAKADNQQTDKGGPRLPGRSGAGKGEARGYSAVVSNTSRGEAQRNAGAVDQHPLHRRDNCTGNEQRETTCSRYACGEEEVKSGTRHDGDHGGRGSISMEGEQEHSGVPGKPLGNGAKAREDHHRHVGTRGEGGRVCVRRTDEQAVQTLDDAVDAARVREGEDPASRPSVALRVLQGSATTETRQVPGTGAGVETEAHGYVRREREGVTEQGPLEAGKSGGGVHEPGRTRKEPSWLRALRAEYGMKGSRPCVYKYPKKKGTTVSESETHVPCACCNETSGKMRKTRQGQSASDGRTANRATRKRTAPSGAARRSARVRARLTPRSPRLGPEWNCEVEIPFLPGGALPANAGACAGPGGRGGTAAGGKDNKKGDG